VVEFRNSASQHFAASVRGYSPVEVPRWRRWRGFVAWALAGGLLFFSSLTGFSIGLFVLPFALLGVLLVARYSSRWPEAIGVAAGIGAVCLLVALGNRDYDPCPASDVLTVPPGETSAECGGLDPTPWLVGGIVLLSVSVAAHAFVRRWRRQPARRGAR
jgi:hypothetical protein